jgi:zinc transporter ZupT
MAAHKSAMRSIELLTSLQPVFMIFCAGMGLLAGLLLFRTRKREYALLRSVGAKRMYALWLLTSEFMLAAIAGALLCVVLSQLIPALREGALFAPIVLVCFLLGIVAAQLMILRESALKSLQTNE